MIVTKKVDLIISNNIRKRYLDLGYEIPKNKCPTVNVKVEDLLKNSNCKIQSKCDICGKINIISFEKYNKNIDRCGFYSCHGKCSRIKFKKTCNIIYGVDNPFELDEIKKKSKNTLLKKYGVDNSMKLKETKIKSQKTYLKNLKENKINDYRIKQFNNKIYYQGTYELDFLKKYYNLGVERAKFINYSFNDDIKIYYPDFYLKEYNLIVEIKSTYIHSLHYKKNIAKEKECLKQGFNYILILDKNYNEFIKIIS